MPISINWRELFKACWRPALIALGAWIASSLSTVLIGMIAPVAAGIVILWIIGTIFGGFLKTAAETVPFLKILPWIVIGAFAFQYWDKIAPILGLP